MKRFWKFLGGAALLSLVVAPALGQVKLANGTVLPDKPFFIVTYIEAAPADAQKTAALIKKHSAATKQKAGNIGSEALQETGRKNHFVLLEVWQDQAARTAHAKSEGRWRSQGAQPPSHPMRAAACRIGMQAGARADAARCTW
jgi:quinol monooxygenase YgiN